MNIILTEHFIESLGKIVDFIAKDSEARADKFADDVFATIQSATFMPKKHRKNEFLGDENTKVDNAVYDKLFDIFGNTLEVK